MKITLLLALLILCAFSGCSVPEQKTEKKPNPNQIIVIVSTPPVETKFKRGLSTYWYRTELTYINDSLNLTKVPLKGGVADTILIKSSREFFELNLSYNLIDRLSYFLQNGDSVLISYDGYKPIAKVLNRIAPSHELNFDLALRQHLKRDSFSLVAMQRVHIPFLPEWLNIAAETSDLFRQIKSQSANEFARSRKFLDSIFVRKEISEEFFSYYVAKIENEQRRIDIDNPKLFFVKIDATSAADSIEAAVGVNFSNHLAHFRFYHDILDLLYRAEGRKVKRHTGEGFNVPDYRALYDSISKSQVLHPEIKKILLIKCFEDIMTNQSASIIHQLKERLKTDLQDSARYNHIIQKYKLNEVISNSLKLSTLNGSATDLQDVVKKNKGKVIYIDFWASWCAPCIRAIPSSKALSAKYKDDVVFIYISKDENNAFWKKAAAKYELMDDRSFLIENLHSSKFIEDLQIQAIPRYLIYDRAGKLLYQNAPGPDSAEIEAIFKKLI
jgi:thiol-disulfide isomerase/thioredoxin